MSFREALDATWQQYLFLIDTIKTYERALERVIKDHPECEKLLALA